LVRAAGFTISATLWDYGTASSANGAQFCTVVARKATATR
jgi:hypothetical protein